MEKPQFKVGDKVVIYRYVLSGVAGRNVGRLCKVISVSEQFGEPYAILDIDCYGVYFSELRHATPLDYLL